MLRGELILSGIYAPIGSVEEVLANAALRRRDDIHYLTTMVLVSAIMHLGQTAKGGSGSDGVRKNIDALMKMIYPGEAEKLEQRAAEVGKILEREVSRGPLQFKVVDDGGRKAAKRKRRRR